jgi:hypothetical protein
VVALLEGDATLSLGLYAATSLSLSEILEMASEASNLGSPVYDSAPPVIRKTLLFPYEAGAEFISSLKQGSDIWRPVNQTYSRPPASTEQILHPAKYLAGEDSKVVALPPLPPLLESDWELVLEDVMGEFLLRTYLGAALGRPAVIRTASGWGGDQFRLLRDGSGRRLFISLIEWDTDIDAREFFDAYRQFTETTGDWVTTDSQANEVRWHYPGWSVLLVLNGDLTLISIAPDPETVALAGSAFP